MRASKSIRNAAMTSQTSSDTPAAPVYRLPVRVYYEDTDAGGVVYYANYLKFFERCRTEWLRALGIDQSVLARENGLQFVVTDLQARYRRPARLDDELSIEVRIGAIGRCSLSFVQLARRGDQVLVQAQVTVACVDIARQLPHRLPALLCERLSQLASE